MPLARLKFNSQNRLISCGLIALISLYVGASGISRAQSSVRPYTITVPVDEVSLTFRVADFHGSTIDDLKASDLRLSDNGHNQTHILSFQHYSNLPVSMGILFDTSQSMLDDLKANQVIGSFYVTHLLKNPTDHAFVMRFDSEDKVVQDWTAESPAIVASLQSIANDHASRLGGTVIFDSIYKACRDQWSDARSQISGNFIMLFTDGIDNASHTRVSDVASICQQSRTTLYVFSNETKSRFSASQKILTALAAQSGGRAFFDPDGLHLGENLRTVEADQRSQYRVVYKPTNMKPDGSFHRVRLTLPKRGGEITVASGYYAAR